MSALAWLLVWPLWRTLSSCVSMFYLLPPTPSLCILDQHVPKQSNRKPQTIAESCVAALRLVLLPSRGVSGSLSQDSLMVWTPKTWTRLLISDCHVVALGSYLAQEFCFKLINYAQLYRKISLSPAERGWMMTLFQTGIFFFWPWPAKVGKMQTEK